MGGASNTQDWAGLPILRIEQGLHSSKVVRPLLMSTGQGLHPSGLGRPPLLRIEPGLHTNQGGRASTPLRIGQSLQSLFERVLSFSQVVFLLKEHYSLLLSVYYTEES